MNHIIRLTLAVSAMAMVTACAKKEEPPPVRATTGKTYVPPRR